MTDVKFSTISFLSDYGHGDEFVGVVHSVIRSVAPDVRVIDITHQVAPHDVRAGGLALARAVPYMAPGLALAIVDPGVGTDRRAVAIEVADGEAYLVGPDNGILAPAVALVGGATAAAVLDNSEYHLPVLGPTFDGRDVFGPAAAHLCLGVPLSELGTPIDPSQLLPGLMPVSEVGDDGSLITEILWIDRFGNAQLNLQADDLAGWPEVVTIEGGRVPRTANRVRTFAEIPAGGFGLLTDSYGLLAVAVDRSSAAAELGLNEGDELVIRPAELGPGGSGRGSNVSPVTLRPKPSVERPEGEEDTLR